MTVEEVKTLLQDYGHNQFKLKLLQQDQARIMKWIRESKLPGRPVRRELMDYFNMVTEEVERVQLRLDQARKLVDSVQDEQGRTVLHLRYIEGRTAEDVATEMYFSNQHLFRIQQKAIASITEPPA